MNKKQAVQKRIRELNPELMELSFGCEIGYTLRGRSHWHLVVHKDGNYVWIVTSVLGGKTWNGTTKKVHVDDLNRIYGHPIHLQHILIAASKTGMLFINEDGVMKNVKTGDTIIYQLHLPFSQQSDEVYGFLYEVLISNNT